MTADRLKDALNVDIPGCLWIMSFDAEGEARPGCIADFDRIGSPGEGFVWLHMDLTDVRTRPLIARIDALSPDARKSLCDIVDHQYLEYSGGIVSGALLDHERTILGPASQTDYIRFAFGAGFLVSARRRPMNCAETLRNEISAGARIATPLALFEKMTNHLADDLQRMTSEIAGTFDHVEDRIVESRGLEARRALAASRRKAVKLSRQIGGLATTISRLEVIKEEPEERRDDELREAAARLAQRTDAMASDIAALQERARLLQDEMNALLNLETNDRLYVLTVVTTMLLPASFVTGFFGMNLKNMPLSESEAGVLYAVLICIGASGLVLYLMRSMGLTRTTEPEAEKRRRDDTPARPADRNF